MKQQNWQRGTAMVLLKSGKRDFLVALSDSIAKGIPCLARASLVTVTWISIFLRKSAGEKNLQSLACSTLMPQLLEALNYDKTLEERDLASFSLLSNLKGPDDLSRLKTIINGELANGLQNSPDRHGQQRSLFQLTQAIEHIDAHTATKTKDGRWICSSAGSH